MKNSIPEVSIAVQGAVQKKLLAKSLRTKVLEEWNRTSVVYPDKCIHDLFEEQMERTPAAVAVECAGSQITYGELNEQANRLAHYIRALGITPEARVGICVERSIEMMVAMLATLKAGAAYVPLDPKYPPERLQYMLADSQAKLLLTQRKVQGPFAESKTTRVVLDTVQEEIDSCPSSSPAVSLETQNAAYVIYTSGSTGKPKGVVIRHSSAVTLLYWARETYSNLELSGVLASTSICFDISVFEIFVPLSWGGTVIIAENGIQLPRLPEAARVTLINTAPAIMNELMKSKEIPAGVRTVNLAGEPLKRRLIEEIYRETGVKRVVNLYGPTEDTTYSTYISLEKGGRGEVPIGRPVANTEVYVLDEDLQPLEIGVAGDLYIGGDGLARGYLDRPELTAQSFIPHPFSKNPGARIYRTGDRARWNKDGILEFLGRVDHQVKVRGMRIELGEIETVLQEHPQVRESTVIVHADETDHKQLAAYFVANPGESPEAAGLANQLRKHLQKRLPEYMVPTYFIKLDEMPLSPNGKIDRNRLPAPAKYVSEEQIINPATALEQFLAHIWEEVLAVESVGLNDNFVNLGGHSLVAMRILARVRDLFQVEVPVQTLLESRTLEDFATAVVAHETVPGQTRKIADVFKRVQSMSA